MEANKKEQWITDTLTSLEGVRRAEAPTDLAEKVAALARGGTSRQLDATSRQQSRWREVAPRARVSARWNLLPRPTWSIAACAVFLLTINVFICLQFGRSSRANQAQSTAFTREYFEFTPPLSL